MRFLILALAVSCVSLVPSAAQAQSEQNVRINADGSFTIIDAPGAKKAKPVAIELVQKPEQRLEEKAEVKYEPEPVAAPAPAPKPQKAATKKPPVEKPKAVVHEEEKFESVFSDEPVEVESPAPVPVKKAEKKKADAKPKAKNKVKSKKQAEQPVAQEPVMEAEELPQEEAGPLTRDDALRIAIQVAPPFKRSTVLPGNYKGRPVFEVILQTEDGDQSILVDAETGELVNPLKKKK